MIETQAPISNPLLLSQSSDLKLTGDRNQCPGCDYYFNSIKAFDRHRTGKHGVDRRCRTVEEMIQRGMLVNKDGFWVTEKMQESCKQRKIDGKLRKTSNL